MTTVLDFPVVGMPIQYEVDQITDAARSWKRLALEVWLTSLSELTGIAAVDPGGLALNRTDLHSGASAQVSVRVT